MYYIMRIVFRVMAFILKKNNTIKNFSSTLHKLECCSICLTIKSCIVDKRCIYDKYYDKLYENNIKKNIKQNKNILKDNTGK